MKTKKKKNMKNMYQHSKAQQFTSLYQLLRTNLSANKSSKFAKSMLTINE